MSRNINSLSKNEVILNVIKYFEEEKEKGALLYPIECATRRAVAATGSSERTICRLKRLANTKTCDISSIGNAKHRPRLKKYELSDLQICSIRRTIMEAYINGNELPSFTKLRKTLNEISKYELNRNYFRLLFLEVGFKFVITSNKQEILVETPYVIADRTSYLKTMQLNDCNSNKPVLYLDESYIGHSLCLSKDTQVRAAKIEDPIRWVVVNCTSCENLFDGNLLIYHSDEKDFKKHNEKDINKLSNWIKHTVVPNLKQPSLVVLCTMPYDDPSSLFNAPTANSNRTVKQEWLLSKKIKFDTKLRNAQLYELIYQHRPKRKNAIEEILKSYGHEVIYLPQHHSHDLNPTEYIWKTMQKNMGTIDVEVLRSPLEIAKMVQTNYRKLTSEGWYEAVAKVKTCECVYWNRDAQIQENISKLNVKDGSGVHESSDDE